VYLENYDSLVSVLVFGDDSTPESACAVREHALDLSVCTRRDAVRLPGGEDRDGEHTKGVGSRRLLGRYSDKLLCAVSLRGFIKGVETNLQRDVG